MASSSRPDAAKMGTMDVERLSAACLAQPEAVMEYPFGEGVRVFKVQGKMFALVPEEARAFLEGSLGDSIRDLRSVFEDGRA